MNWRRRRDIGVLPEDGPTVPRPAAVAHAPGETHTLLCMGSLISGESQPVRVEQLLGSFGRERKEGGGQL